MLTPNKTILLFCSIPFLVILVLLPWFLLFRAMSHKQPIPISDFSGKTVHEVRFNAVGDIMLSRTVAQKIRNTNNPFFPFQKMAPQLLASDFNF